jgi:glyoxylase-like metal-dependent hydrolase (beta-lactamase superfamily II)
MIMRVEIIESIPGSATMRSIIRTTLCAILLYIGAGSANALETVKVADNVYALVGPTTQRSAENFGNNATFGVIVTGDGVILVDPGGCAKGAAEIDAAVKVLTGQPVKIVINTGGQDHRWFGNAYFKDRGAEIIAANAAVEDQQNRSNAQWQMMTMLTGDATMAGTDLVYADRRFDKTITLTLGGVRVDVTLPAQAHTPGDTFVWLPEQRIVFAGDIVFMDRMLGVLPSSNSKSWLEAFAAIEKLNPAIVVPGHGNPGPLARAQAETRDYLRHLRKEIGALIEAGGSMIDAKKIDQSAFSSLAVFDQISRRNAQAVFAEMEFE